MRAARVARFFLTIRPIKFSICSVFIALAVVDAKAHQVGLQILKNVALPYQVRIHYLDSKSTLLLECGECICFNSLITLKCDTNSFSLFIVHLVMCYKRIEI